MTGNEEKVAATQIFGPPVNLRPPKALRFDENLATSWKWLKQAWNRYEIDTGVYKQEVIVGESTLLSIIGEDDVKAYTFQLERRRRPKRHHVSFVVVRSVLCTQNASDM